MVPPKDFSEDFESGFLVSEADFSGFSGAGSGTLSGFFKIDFNFCSGGLLSTTIGTSETDFFKFETSAGFGGFELSDFLAGSLAESVFEGGLVEDLSVESFGLSDSLLGGGIRVKNKGQYLVLARLKFEGKPQNLRKKSSIDFSAYFCCK